ncbi:hypothetical protein GCM10010136_32320 [Limoniibacter endophyticus]|uniref:Uncharacterized protein n=1 Tax=Limoniibacter endophyticus TaxID=1565040 RepID=A0A8J3DT24_9HYPH|nr:hypothetical protein GCM10010136_32320 [Limoniibacter endophyticus]
MDVIDPERDYLAGAVSALESPSCLQAFRPDRDEQMAAIEILLSSRLPAELRCQLREFEQSLVLRKDAA